MLFRSCDFEEASTSTLRRYVADHARRENLVLPPGAAFSYSNPGYALAGRLIETVTGMSWSEAVESILLRPLDIEPAFVSPPGTNSPRRPLASGHSVNASVGRTRPVQQSAVPAPIGGLALSAVDLVKLGLIHIEPGAPQLLPAADAAEALARFYENGPQRAQQDIHIGLFASPHRKQVIRDRKSVV